VIVTLRDLSFIGLHHLHLTKVLFSVLRQFLGSSLLQFDVLVPNLLELVPIVLIGYTGRADRGITVETEEYDFFLQVAVCRSVG
jgi:hypothetical protein